MNTPAVNSLKKRVMFSISEDYYFITYNALLLLSDIGASSEANAFLDHRRLAFLVEFVSDPTATAALNKAVTNHADREILRNAYSRGLARMPIVSRLVFGLEQKNVLRSQKGALVGERDLFLREQEKLEFLGADVFAVERANIAALRKLFPSVRRSRMANTLQRLFRDSGVEPWGL